MSVTYTPDTHCTVTTSCGLTVTVCCPHAAPVVLPPDGGCCGPTPDPLPDPVTPPVEPGGPATLSAGAAPDFVVNAPAGFGVHEADILAVAETLIALLKRFVK